MLNTYYFFYKPLPCLGDVASFLVNTPYLKRLRRLKIFFKKKQINLVMTEDFNERKKAHVLLNKIRI